MSLMNDALRKRDREARQTPAPESPFQDSGWRTNKKRLYWLAVVVLIISSALIGIHFVQSIADNQPLIVNRKYPDAPSPLWEKAPMPSTNGKESDAAAVNRTREEDEPPKANTDATQSPETAEDNPVRKPTVQVSGPSIPEPTATAADTAPQSQELHKIVRIDTKPDLPAAAAQKQTNPNHSRNLEPIPPQLGSTGKKITVTVPPPKDRIHQHHSGNVQPSATNIGRPQDDSADIDATFGRSSEQIEPFYRKALANHRDGHLSEALRLYRKVLMADPDHKGAIMNLAAIALAKANYREAQSHLKRLEHAQPRQPGVLLNLAIAAIGTGDYPTALTYLDRARLESDAPTWDIRFHRAVAYSHLNRPQDALEIYEAALEERPYDPRLRFNLAVSYDRLERYEEALSQYEAVVQYKDASMKIDEAAIAWRIKTLRRHLDEKRQREKGR